MEDDLTRRWSDVDGLLQRVLDPPDGAVRLRAPAGDPRIADAERLLAEVRRPGE